MSKSAILTGILVLSMLAAFSAFVPWTQVAEAQEPFILNVSVQDEMKTRNAIRFNFFTGDVWTADVMGPVFDGTIQEHPETLARLPYVMVGTDVNGDGNLDMGEVGTFARETTDPEFWTAFYDVTDLRFHDGTPVKMIDVLIGYHLEALSPGGDRFMKNLAGGAGTNYTADRYLHLNKIDITWLGADPNENQFAFRFKQTGPNAEFDRNSLQTVILPAYFWQGTGCRDRACTVKDIHPDFGQIINPVTNNGVPVGGLPGLKEYDIIAASEWDAQDEDVIGTGAFRFDTWLPGRVARIEKNPDYFVPNYEATLAAGLRVPALDAITYRLFRNVQAGVFALQSGDVDFLDWFVPPEFVGPLLSDPNVGVITSADAGYFYIGYNMRRLPFGYIDPVQGSNLQGNDIGRPFRIAVGHAIDKGTIVTTLLQNFGIPGHTVVSPTNTLYYNASAPRYAFSLSEATDILDAAANDPVLGPLGYGLNPPEDCQRDGFGCRTLPGRGPGGSPGTGLFHILTPQADYDPIRAAAGALIAQNLRKIGINVDSQPTAFGQIVVRVFEEQDFDIWILGWSLTGFIVPSYIESFFHSRNTVLDGNNPEGYVNAQLDAIIDAAEGATDQSDAVDLWKQAQGIVATDLPTDVLYFRTNIFAFRQDRIDPASWRTDIGGDIYWFWSRILLDPAPAGLIRASVVAPSAVASGDTAQVVVTVRDAEGNPLSGATVDVALKVGSPGSIAPAMGTTDANGQFTATFTAPTLAPTDTKVTSIIDIQATDPDLGAALPVSVGLTTFPPGASFLSLFVETPFGNAVDEGASTVIDISIVDETGLAAQGTSVILTPSPTATLTPSSFTTGPSGRESVTFTAPEVDADTSFTITVVASRQGVEGQSQITVIVLDVPVAPAAPISAELVLIIVGVIGVGVAGGGYAWWRRRRK
ncbi:MAG: ABC transporter substrate-binding protein [Thermoplasmata archaeon]